MCYFLNKGEGGRSKPIMNKYIQVIFMDTWNVPFRLDIPRDLGIDMIMPGEQSRYRCSVTIGVYRN